MSTSILERILYIAGGFFIGTLVTLFIDMKSLHSMIDLGYQRAVDDILSNHMYHDKNKRWHQLSIVWRDLSE